MAAIDDPDRLAALHDSGVLAEEGLPGLERLLRIARHSLGAPTAMFSAVDTDRQVFVGHLGLLQEWAEPGETPLSHSYCRLVVTHEAPLVVSDAPRDARVCDNPATSEAGIGAYLGVPVRYDGHTLGSLCVIDASPREWTEDELAILGDLAASVEVELRLRDSTRELSDQLASESLEREFEESMATMAAATSRSWTVGAVVRAIVENGRAATGASLVTVALHENDTLRIFDTEHDDPTGPDSWITIDIDRATPMAEAARTEQTLMLTSPAGLADWPEFAAEMSRRDIKSFVAIPVGDTDSGGKAVIGVGWTRPMSGRELPRSVVRLGALARQGLDRAHSHQAAREHAELLESLVLPDNLPDVAGLDIAGLYLPPSAGQRVGGDLYDAVLRDDGRVALIVADAAGHDLVGSLVTSRVRNAFTMLSLDLLTPAEILRYINRYLLRSSISTHITAVVALVDIEAETVTIANAGHPQPRVRRSDGRVEPVGPAGEPLLALQPVEYTEETSRFAPGDTIVLFTDGLIERRDRPLTVSEEWLERELRTSGTGPAASAVDHFAALLPTRDDDMALIVVRRLTHTTEPELELRWPADRVELGEARRQLEQWIGNHPRLGDVQLVATELLTNARAASDPEGTVTLRGQLVEGEVVISVGNTGASFGSTDRPMPDVAEERGRGLAMASAIADLSVENHEGVVTVIARVTA